MMKKNSADKDSICYNKGNRIYFLDPPLYQWWIFYFIEGGLMDSRTINEHYAEIGADLIATEEALTDIADSSATIVYLSSTHKKTGSGKVTKAECEKISEKYKWGIPCDFTITVFEPNIEGMTEEQIRILIFHELLHIKIEFNEDGTETYGTWPHDLEDFKLIIDRFGTDWSKVDGDD